MKEIEKLSDDWEKIHNYKINSNKRNVEPIKDVCCRVWNLLDNMKNENKDILIVTHAGICRIINAYFNGIGEDGKVVSSKMENGEIREFEF